MSSNISYAHKYLIYQLWLCPLSQLYQIIEQALILKILSPTQIKHYYPMYTMWCVCIVNSMCVVCVLVAWYDGIWYVCVCVHVYVCVCMCACTYVNT